MYLCGPWIQLRYLLRMFGLLLDFDFRGNCCTVNLNLDIVKLMMTFLRRGVLCDAWVKCKKHYVAKISISNLFYIKGSLCFTLKGKGQKWLIVKLSKNRKYSDKTRRVAVRENPK